MESDQNVPSMKESEAQKRLDRIVDSDPAGLRQFALRFSSTGEVDTQYNHYIYILFVLIPMLGVLSLFFYAMAMFDGWANGTPDQELDHLVEDKLKLIMYQAEQNRTIIELLKQKKVEEEHQAAASAKPGDIDQVAYSVLNPFNNVSFGLNLVPPLAASSAPGATAGAAKKFFDSYLQHLLQRTSLISDSMPSEEIPFYNEDSVGDLASNSESPKFFHWERWSQAANSFQFQPISFDEEHLPIGDSIRYCLGLYFSPKAEEYDALQFKPIKGFDQCYNAVPGRGKWGRNFPSTGLNFRSWLEKKVRMSKDQESCDNDYEIYLKPYCYSYEVLKKVCLLVKFQKEQDIPDYQKGVYTWTFTGGCFKNNQAVLYEQADPFRTYSFDDVQIEVRLDHRVSEFFSGSDLSDESDEEMTVSLNRLHHAIEESKKQPRSSHPLPEEEVEEDDVEGDEQEFTLEKMVDPKLQVEKMKADLILAKKRGELQPEGYYFVYNLLLFLAKVFLLLDILCVMALAFYMGGMVCNTKMIEGAKENQDLIRDSQATSGGGLEVVDLQ